MAVEVEGTNQVEEFLGILKRRAWWIAIPTFVIGALGIAVAVIVPKKFVATAQVLVRDVTGLVQNSSAGAVSRMEGNVAPHVIGSGQRAAQILRELDWRDYFEKPFEEQTEYRQKLVENLDIDLFAVPNNAGAQIVRVKFSHTNPQRAYDFLSRIVDTWKHDVQARFEASERKVLETWTEHADQLEAELIRVSKELEEKHRVNHIRPDIVMQGGQKSSLLASSEFGLLDKVRQELEDEEDAIKALEGQLERWQVEFDAARVSVARLADGGGDELSRAIEDLTRRKDELDLELSTKGWTPNSTKYQLKQNELRGIIVKLDELRAARAGGVSAPEEEPNPERIALMRQMKEARGELMRRIQQREILEARRKDLHERTDQLFTEHQDINYLQAQFEVLTEQLKTAGERRRIQQSQVDKIESDAGKFFEDLVAPFVPTRPTTPNPYVVAGLFQAVGLALGFGLAVLSELSRSTFRSARDLSRVMVVPVLGTVNRIVTRRQRSRLFFAHVALATGTLALVSVVGYVTWAWVYDPSALSEPVLNAIRGLREPFL